MHRGKIILNLFPCNPRYSNIIGPTAFKTLKEYYKAPISFGSMAIVSNVHLAFPFVDINGISSRWRIDSWSHFCCKWTSKMVFVFFLSLVRSQESARPFPDPWRLQTYLSNLPRLVLIHNLYKLLVPHRPLNTSPYRIGTRRLFLRYWDFTAMRRLGDRRVGIWEYGNGGTLQFDIHLPLTLVLGSVPLMISGREVENHHNMQLKLFKHLQQAMPWCPTLIKAATILC